jgi:hypothetical protein
MDGPKQGGGQGNARVRLTKPVAQAWLAQGSPDNSEQGQPGRQVDRQIQGVVAPDLVLARWPS